MHALARSLLAGTLALGVAGLPPVAHASPFSVPTIDSAPTAGSDQLEETEEDPTIAEAKAEYRAGSDAYALGNYEEAVAHFERSYELTHQPELLFNLGQSYTRWYDISNDLEHLKKARRLYENYVLNVGATDIDDEQQAQARADAQRRIAEVDRRIAQHEDSTEPTPNDDKPKKPVHKKAWFWVTIVGGLAVVGGVTAAIVLTSNRDSGFEPELGTLGRAPLTGGGQAGGLRLRF